MMKRFIFLGTLILILALCSVIFFRLLLNPEEPFPKLQDGRYIGYFSADLIGIKNQNAFFSVQADQNSSPNLSLKIYASGWGVRSFNLNQNAESRIALIVTDRIAPEQIAAEPGTVLRFGGKQISQNVFSGTITNLSTGKKSPWFLYNDNSSKTANLLTSEFGQLPTIMAERSMLEMQIMEQQAKSDFVVKERDRLLKALSEEKVLEQKGENRFNEKQIEIEKLKSEIAVYEDALKNMQSSLNIARSITQKGRLATISREILSREYREINLRTSVSKEEDARLMAESAVAKEALALKKELSSQGVEDREILNGVLP